MNSRSVYRPFFKLGLLALVLAVSFCAPPAFAQSAFRRGDIDTNGRQNVADTLTFLVNYFRTGPGLPCRDAADLNDDGNLTLADAIHGLVGLFGLGAPPAPPFPDCGLDVTDDELDCRRCFTCPPATEPDIYRPFNNGIVCITHPCFSWTAERRDGAEVAISDIDLSLLDEVPDGLLSELARGEWLVLGAVIDGPEGPAGQGRTLVVLDLIGSSVDLYRPLDNGLICFTDPCFNWTVDRSDGIEISISNIDISRLETVPDGFLSELARGEWLVSAAVIDGPEGPAGLGRTLVILDLIGAPESIYRPHDNGIRCVTWPCPSWDADRWVGAPEQFTDISVDTLVPPPRDPRALINELYFGRWWVEGRFVEGPTGPAGDGRTLEVTRLVQRIEPTKPE